MKSLRAVVVAAASLALAGATVTTAIADPLSTTDRSPSGTGESPGTSYRLLLPTGDVALLTRLPGAGQRAGQEWWPAISRPAIPDIGGGEADGIPVARFEDAIRVAIPHFVSGDRDIYGWGQYYDRTSMELRRNGKPVGNANWTVAQFPVPRETAEFELDLKVERTPDAWATTSTKTHTVWGFRSGHVSGRTVLPLLQVDYRLETDGANEIETGEASWLYLTPDYQPGAHGPGRIATSAEVSYDGGKTWIRMSTANRGSGVVAARLPAAPDGAKSADLRVTVRDRAGNRMTQLIEKAWLLK